MDNSTGNSQLSNRTSFDASSLYADLAPLVFTKSELKVDTDAPAFVKAVAFADALDNLGHDLNLPMRLRDVGIESSDIDKLASEAMKQTRLLPNNPREILLTDAVDLYSRVY